MGEIHQPVRVHPRIFREAGESDKGTYMIMETAHSSRNKCSSAATRGYAKSVVTNMQTEAALLWVCDGLITSIQKTSSVYKRAR